MHNQLHQYQLRSNLNSLHTPTQALAKQFHYQSDHCHLPSKLDSLCTSTQALARQFHNRFHQYQLASKINSLRTSTQALAKKLHIRFDQSQLPRPQGSQPTMCTTPLCYLSLPLPLCNLFLCALLPLASIAPALVLPMLLHCHHLIVTITKNTIQTIQAVITAATCTFTLPKHATGALHTRLHPNIILI